MPASVASAAGFPVAGFPATGFPKAASTSSRTHSPGVTPWVAAKDSSCAYSSSLSLVPTDRVRRTLVWLERTDLGPAPALRFRPGRALSRLGIKALRYAYTGFAPSMNTIRACESACTIARFTGGCAVAGGASTPRNVQQRANHSRKTARRESSGMRIECAELLQSVHKKLRGTLPKQRSRPAEIAFINFPADPRP
jgi:hypothetical protein